jgi:tetratricopeptide (TPR) repeat protein
MFYLAVLLQTSGRSEEALELYQRVLELQPDNRIVINNLAWLMCEDKGMLQEALQLAQKGLKIHSSYIDLIDTRGTIYYKMGEFDKAMEDFTACISLYPTGRPALVGSHIHLAKTFAKLGQNDKAVEHLNQAFALNQALKPEKRIGGSEMNEAQLLLKQLQEGN